MAFNFFCELVSTARIFQNTYPNETGEKTGQPCGVLSCFLCFVSTARTFQKPTAEWAAKRKTTAKTFPKPTPEWDTIKKKKTMWRFNFFLWIDFHSKNLPEPYTSTRPKNTGKQCGVLSFFVVHLHSQHVPAEWETKNKNKVETFQKPTPEWDTIRKEENQVAF